MQIAKKLNIIHVVHFTLILSAIFVINFFILKEVVYKNLTEIYQQQADHINHKINTEFENLQKTALQLSKENPNEQLIDSTHLLNLSITPNWFHQVLDDIFISEPSSLIILNSECQIIYSHKVDSEWNVSWLKENIINNERFKTYEAKVLKNARLFQNNTYYLAYVSKNEKLNSFLVFYIPNKSVFKFLRNYPLIITIIFVFLLAFLLTMVIRTNIRYTQPISELANNLKNNPYLKFNNRSNANEINTIQRSFDAMQNQLDFYIKNLEKATKENQKIDNDIQIAKRLQRNILPDNSEGISTQPAFKIQAISEAAFDLGGDFYDYFMLDKTHLMFLVADVAGKGIPASLYMIFAHTLLRTIANHTLSVAQIAEQLNHKLIEENISDLFVTMLLAILNTETGKVEFCNAAHNQPIVIRESGVIEEVEDVHGIPLGIYENRNYGSSTIQLNPNDQLLFYTDGVTDTKDENGMNFSIDVLKYNLIGAWFNSPDQVIMKLQDDIESFRGNVDPADDLTLLLVKYIREETS